MAQNLQSLTERLTRKKSKQKGGGTKKHTRNAAKCKLYRERRAVPNKLRKLRRHLKVHANDQCALSALQNLSSAPPTIK